MTEQQGNPRSSKKLSSPTQWDAPKAQQRVKQYPQPRNWDRWQSNTQQQNEQGYEAFDFESGGQEPPKKNNTVLIAVLIALAAALLTVMAVILIVVANGKCSNKDNPASESAKPTATEVQVSNPPIVTDPPAPVVTDPPVVTPQTEAPAALIRKNGKAVYSADALSQFDVVTFGRYPQSSMGDTAPIEWYVVQIDGNKVQLISRYCLDSRPFHGKNKKVSFRSSDLYQWLNDEFKRSAFTEEERSMLAREILLPEKGEVLKILPQDYRKATGTDYAISHGFDTRNNVWWLGEFSRTTYTYGTIETTEHNCAYAVIGDGSDVWDYQVDFHGKGVRPLIVIQF